MDIYVLFQGNLIVFLHLFQLLCDAGCYKDVSNKYGVTPVYEAAMKGMVIEIRCLAHSKAE